MNSTKQEFNQLKNRCNESIKEQGIGEINELKQQCTNTKYNWDLTFQDYNDLQETVINDQYQHEEVVKEMNEAIACSVKSSQELKHLNKAHGATVEECKLIWNGHNSVCNELKKLSDDLSSTHKKNKQLECEIKSCRSEIKTLKLNNESLKHEISLALQDRDKALKKNKDYKKRFGLISAENKFHSKLNCDLNRDREKQDDLREQLVSLDCFGTFQKKRIDNTDQAYQEIKHLRKLADKYHDELSRKLEEAETSKIRHDSAINELDKLVLDCNKLQNLYDGLKKKCDHAFNKLADATRNCDVAKQKSDNIEEQDDLKEEMGIQLRKETCSPQFQAANHLNQDIDTYIQDSDTEILNIDLGVLDSNEDLGIDLLGGIDDPLYPNDDAIYISSVNKGSLAARKLRVNDCILKVNGLDCSSVSKQSVLETMKTLRSATFVLRRKKQKFPSKSLFTTKSQPKNFIDLGITLETGILIKKITPGSITDKIGNLAVGDRVLSINKTSLEDIKTSREAMLLLQEPVDVLNIKTIKSVCNAENSDSDLNCDVFKKYTNTLTQSNESSYLIYQESNQERQTKKETFDVLDTSSGNYSPINYVSDSYEDEFISDTDSVFNAFTPYPTPTGSPITYHSRKPFKPNEESQNIRVDETAGIPTRKTHRPVNKKKKVSTSFIVEFLIPEQMPADRIQSLSEYDTTPRYLKKWHGKDLRPLPGDIRWISIKKTHEPLGIKVLRTDRGVLFVAGVNKHSVAYNVGLQVGDQLLEVNEVNLRNATNKTAIDVLKHCMHSVTMLVQFSPDKMFHQTSLLYNYD